MSHPTGSALAAHARAQKEAGMASEMVERVTKALLISRYGSEVLNYWPDDLASFVSGPPFQADGYRVMARAAIEAMPVNDELVRLRAEKEDLLNAAENFRDMLEQRRMGVPFVDRDDIDYLERLSETMGFGRTWEALKRVVSALRSRAALPQGEPVAWRYRNELGEIVSEWIDGQPPEYVRDVKTGERVAVRSMQIDVAYAAPAQSVAGTGLADAIGFNITLHDLDNAAAMLDDIDTEQDDSRAQVAAQWARKIRVESVRAALKSVSPQPVAEAGVREDCAKIVESFIALCDDTVRRGYRIKDAKQALCRDIASAIRGPTSPSDGEGKVGWMRIWQAARDEYWAKRKDDCSEEDALRAAVDTAVAITDGDLPAPPEVKP